MDAESFHRLSDLEAAFQSIADRHSWVCLSTGCVIGGQHVSPRLGVLAGTPLPNFGLSGIAFPEDPAAQRVLDHVQQLTYEAERLLFSCLQVGSSVPGDTRQQVAEWEQRCHGYGWIRWLMYATPSRDTRRIENYPQVAATALRVLKDHCQSKVVMGKNAKPRKRGRKPKYDPKVDERIYDANRSGHYAGYTDVGRQFDMSEREVEKAIDRHRDKLRRREADRATE